MFGKGISGSIKSLDVILKLAEAKSDFLSAIPADQFNEI
jgi:hypothetical protein